MRSPAEMDIIQIDIHNKCHLSCTHCTRLIAHQSKKWEMDLPTFEAAVKSMDGWYKPGYVLGIIAGEPTLHSQFAELSRLFAGIFGGPTNRHGRKPIRDFNAWAQERLFDRTSGRGLWTSLGARFYDHMEVIMDTYDHFNVNTHEAGGLHQAMLIHRDDYCEQTGTSIDQWEERTDNCWVQRLWSASINDKGAYPCEVMASIDRLYFDGAHAWKVEKDWWKRTPAEFGAMRELCNYCSLAQVGPSRVDSVERDIVSPKNLIQLELAGSPAVKRGEFDLYDPAVHDEQRLVQTKDNYVKDFRVAPDHASVKPKSVACVVTCVGRAHHLAQTLPRNVPHVDEMIVVTTSYDEDTQAVVRAAQAKGATVAGNRGNIRLVISDACHDGYDSFNKGKLTNAGLRTITKPDWIILTDADVFLSHETGGFLKEYVLNPGVLYGTFRSNLHDANEVRQYVAGSLVPAPSKSVVDAEPNGYFHLFNRRASAISSRWPAVMSEAFCSAGGIDSWFMQQWPRDKLCMVGPLGVAHIAHGDKLGADWNAPAMGEGVGQWRQWGMLTAKGVYALGGLTWSKPIKLRLTDTRRGEQWTGVIGDGKIPDDVVKGDGKGDLVFLGKPLHGAHVHVAAWTGEAR